MSAAARMRKYRAKRKLLDALDKARAAGIDVATLAGVTPIAVTPPKREAVPLVPRLGLLYDDLRAAGAVPW